MDLILSSFSEGSVRQTIDQKIDTARFKNVVFRLTFNFVEDVLSSRSMVLVLQMLAKQNKEWRTDPWEVFHHGGTPEGNAIVLGIGTRLNFFSRKRVRLTCSLPRCNSKSYTVRSQQNFPYRAAHLTLPALTSLRRRRRRWHRHGIVNSMRRCWATDSFLGV